MSLATVNKEDNSFDTSVLVGKSIMKLAREGRESRIQVYLKMLLEENAFEKPEKALAITDMFISPFNRKC